MRSQIARSAGFGVISLRLVGLVVLTAAIVLSPALAQVTVSTVDADADSPHLQYRMHMELQGEDMFWTVVQGEDLARIRVDEGYESRLAGMDPLYTGPALDNRAHELAPRFGAMVPVISGSLDQPPVEYEDMFDNLQRLDAVEIVLRPLDEGRDIAGRSADAYVMAVVSEKRRRQGDEWLHYAQVNYGTVWIYPDLPFSPAPLQLSQGVFNFVFAPSAAPGTGDFYQQRLIEALEPLGMLAGAKMRSFTLNEDMLAELEEQDWRLEDGQSPGQAQGMEFELLLTELAEDATPLDYAAVNGMPRLDAAGLEFLEGPLMAMDLLRLCPPLPDDLSQSEMQGLIAEQATFHGEMQGPLDGAINGTARFGSQDDSFGRGFVLTVEAFDEPLDQAACLALLRVEDGKPAAAGTLPVSAEFGGDVPEPGDMIAYLVLADFSEEGVVREVAVGAASEGSVAVETSEQELIQGSFELSGNVTTLDDLTESRGFTISGEFTADRAWDRVPVRR